MLSPTPMNNWLFDLNLDWLVAALRIEWSRRFEELCHISVIPTIFLHFVLIKDHFSYWPKPKEQRIMVLLLFIPPVQSLVSYLHFLFPNNVNDTLFIIFDSIKECYTALIFPLFLSLLYTHLKLNDETLSSIYVRVIIGRRHITNIFPVTLIQPECVSISLDNLKHFEYSTWQFVVVRLVSSVSIILFQLLGIYPLWLSCVFSVVLNLSLLLALYTVYVFYHAFFDDFRLSQRRMFNFFRLIVFACYFQGTVIRIVKETGIIQANLQNMLVIVEMLFFAVPTARLAFPALLYDRPAPVLPVVEPVSCQPSFVVELLIKPLDNYLFEIV